MLITVIRPRTMFRANSDLVHNVTMIGKLFPAEGRKIVFPLPQTSYRTEGRVKTDGTAIGVLMKYLLRRERVAK